MKKWKRESVYVFMKTEKLLKLLQLSVRFS